jgi:hypothetical protein
MARANYGPPRRGPEGPWPGVGASPSGKAADFDSAIRRFESSRPSHAVPVIAQCPSLLEKPRNSGTFARRFCRRDQKSQVFGEHGA